jgi:hypothetical protein
MIVLTAQQDSTAFKTIVLLDHVQRVISAHLNLLHQLRVPKAPTIQRHRKSCFQIVFLASLASSAMTSELLFLISICVHLATTAQINAKSENQ